MRNESPLNRTIVAGLSKRAFAELLSVYRVSIFNYPPADLAKEISNA